MIVRAARITALVMTLLIATAAPAYADPDPSSPEAAINPTSPTLTITINYVTGGHYVCADGHLNGAAPTALGSWQMVITGARSNASAITYSAGTVGTTFHACTTVSKQSTSYGGYEVHETYVGVGDDLSFAAVGVGTWRPEGDNHIIA